MKGKAALIAGLAAGYVLGTRDGRSRYEQIKGRADRLWSDPRVQEQASKAEDLVRAKAPRVADKVVGTVSSTGSTGGDDSDTGAPAQADLQGGTQSPDRPTPTGVAATESATPLNPTSEDRHDG